MGDLRDVLERAAEGYRPGRDQWDRTMDRARHRERRRRMAAGSLAMIVAVVGLAGAVVALRPRGIPTSMPTSVATTPSSPTPAPRVHVVKDRTLRLGQLGGLVAAEDAFGSVWAVLITDGGEEVVRADSITGATDHRFPLSYFPAHEWGGQGLAVGDGALWVAGADTGNSHATITRIDPATNAQMTIPIEGRAVVDIAFDSGTLWALVSQSTPHESTVVAIDPSTTRIVSSTKFKADWSGGIVADDGHAWAIERDVQGSTVEGGRLVQIVPGGPPPITLGGSFALPVSDGTSIWAPYFGDSQAMNMAGGIARIDPTTGDLLDEWPTDAIGYDLAVGQDGGIWFLSGDHLDRLSTLTGETDVKVAVSGQPIFLVPTDGAIWVGTYGGELVRFVVKDVAS
jgi:hypothetical protein